MSSESFISVSAGIGGGFLGGLLLGYILKKVIKLIAVIIGLFVAALAYLQYQQIAYLNWGMMEQTITTLATAMVTNINDNNLAIAAMSNFGIPLTGSMASGFTLGWIKG